MSRLKIVLDTNVLVSGLAYPGSIPGRILGLWRTGALEVVLSRYILEETARVLPRLSRITLNQGEIRDLVESLAFLANLVEPAASHEEDLRDGNDLPVLATLLSSEADYLIAGDKDLLALSSKYAIITPATFWERHS